MHTTQGSPYAQCFVSVYVCACMVLCACMHVCTHTCMQAFVSRFLHLCVGQSVCFCVCFYVHPSYAVVCIDTVPMKVTCHSRMRDGTNKPCGKPKLLRRNKIGGNCLHEDHVELQFACQPASKGVKMEGLTVWRENEREKRTTSLAKASASVYKCCSFMREAWGARLSGLDAGHPPTNRWPEAP